MSDRQDILRRIIEQDTGHMGPLYGRRTANDPLPSQLQNDPSFRTMVERMGATPQEFWQSMSPEARARTTARETGRYPGGDVPPPTQGYAQVFPEGANPSFQEFPPRIYPTREPAPPTAPQMPGASPAGTVGRVQAGLTPPSAAPVRPGEQGTEAARLPRPPSQQPSEAAQARAGGINETVRGLIPEQDPITALTGWIPGAGMQGLGMAADAAGTGLSAVGATGAGARMFDRGDTARGYADQMRAPGPDGTPPDAPGDMPPSAPGAAGSGATAQPSAPGAEGGGLAYEGVPGLGTDSRADIQFGATSPRAAQPSGPRQIAQAGMAAAAMGEPAPVEPMSPEMFDPETGERPEEARKLGLLERMFGERDSPEYRNAGKALMMAGAAIMGTDGNLGQALANGIQAGLMTYDEAMQALQDEENEARKLGMQEEAHALNMELKRLQIQRAQMGGQTSGPIQKVEEFTPIQRTVMMADEFTQLGLAPDESLRSALNRVYGVPASLLRQQDDPFAQFTTAD